MLKLNPVNAYLGPVFARVFASLIEDGFVRIAGGGAEAGAYLCAHPGGRRDSPDRRRADARRDRVRHRPRRPPIARRQRRPLLDKPITSELGNVTPVIVVPGPWSDADLAFQAAHVATMKLHNAGANCIAAQVARDGRVVGARAALRRRAAPSAGERARAAVVLSRLARAAAPHQRPPRARRDHRRAVGPRSAHLRRGPRSGRPRRAAVPHRSVRAGARADGARRRRRGERSCATRSRSATNVCAARSASAILIHPRTIAELGSAFEDAVAALRYGCVAINTWPGVGFLLPTASWGAFPGQHAGGRRQRHRHRPQHVPVRPARKDDRARAVRAVPAFARRRRTDDAAQAAVVRDPPARGRGRPQRCSPSPPHRHRCGWRRRPSKRCAARHVAWRSGPPLEGRRARSRL